MMERLTQNLIDNGVKATPGDGSIHAYMKVEGDELIFTIENSGDPLPEDLLQWINNSKTVSGLLTKRPAKPGLGPVIVQKILLLHKTSLQAYSNNNTNVFTLRKPVYHHTA